MNEPMTYGEFTKRRAAILAKITIAQAKRKAVNDDRHTPMSPDGASIADAYVASLEKQLADLVSAYQSQQKTEGV